MKMKKGGSMQQELRPANFVGGKKANGHKSTCKCPICVNMKHQKASKKNRRVTRNRTMKGGVKRDRNGKIIVQANNNDDDDDNEDNQLPANNLQVQFDAAANNAENNADDEVENMDDAEDIVVEEDNDMVVEGDDMDKSVKKQRKEGGKKKRKSNGHKANCKCPICKNMKMKRGGALDDDSDSSSDSSSDSDSDSDSSSDSDSDTTTDAAMGGGKKKRKGNGHKAACKCPICKNMKKGGVKSPYAKEDPDNAPTDSHRANGALVEAEMGESEFGKKEREKEIEKEKEKEKAMAKNKPDLGGSRRRRKTRKSRKTRKIRRRR
jgi:hypothetical protein